MKTDDGPSLYWLIRNSRSKAAAFFRKHRRVLLLSGLAAAVLAFIFRAWLHPAAIALRCLGFPLLAAFLLGGFFLRLMSKGSGRRRIASAAGAALVLLALCGWGGNAYRYLALYVRYRTLDIRELNELPISGHERIHPRNSIYSLAHEKITESEDPSYPDLVRVGSEYRWTASIEPAYPLSRFFGGVFELLNTGVAEPSPNFEKENRNAVRFELGQSLYLSHNSLYAVIRSFGPLRYFNYQPVDVIYFPDDKGEWIQAVALIRWRGFFFPRPEFGGVQIIRQGQSGLGGSIRRLFTGAGQWIPPEQTASHPFLKGQNVLSPVISRNIADSLRFQEGFLAPLPGYHYEDARVPELDDEALDQPFTGYFELPGGSSGQLFHYFGLEPLSREKQGLTTSLFIPADGTPVVYVYRHYRRGGALTGVSAVSAKVMESRKVYDWSHNRPAEHRPFIRHVGGEIRFFWLTTVVTHKESSGKSFIAGSLPDVILTDARFNASTWVNPLTPGDWTSQVESELGPLWNKEVRGPEGG